MPPPTVGATDSRTNAIAAELGERIVLWDIDTQDWHRPGPGRITDHILANAPAGAVILMHDGGGERSQTVQAPDATLATLKARGYAFAVMCD